MLRESLFQNPGNFCVWIPGSWALESGIQLKESGILLKIGIQCKLQVPLESSSWKYPESMAWNAEPKTALDSLTWVEFKMDAGINKATVCRCHHTFSDLVTLILLSRKLAYKIFLKYSIVVA